MDHPSCDLPDTSQLLRGKIYFRPFVPKCSRNKSETRGKQTALIDEMIGNQKVVKAFGYEEKASERFAEINKDLQKYSQQAVFYSSLTNPSTRFVNNVIYAGVALCGSFHDPGRRADRRRTFRSAVVRKPVYETVQ